MEHAARAVFARPTLRTGRLARDALLQAELARL